MPAFTKTTIPLRRIHQSRRHEVEHEIEWLPWPNEHRHAVEESLQSPWSLRSTNDRKSLYLASAETRCAVPFLVQHKIASPFEIDLHRQWILQNRAKHRARKSSHANCRRLLWNEQHTLLRRKLAFIHPVLCAAMAHPEIIHQATNPKAGL